MSKKDESKPPVISIDLDWPSNYYDRPDNNEKPTDEQLRQAFDIALRVYRGFSEKVRNAVEVIKIKFYNPAGAKKMTVRFSMAFDFVHAGKMTIDSGGGSLPLEEIERWMTQEVRLGLLRREHELNNAIKELKEEI